MKAFSLAILLATRALAQTGVPACAQPCVAGFTSGSTIGGCNGVDVVCICSNNNFLSNIACCLAEVCDQADQQATISYVRQICATDGVTNLPKVVSCLSSFSSASSAKVTSTSSTVSAIDLTSGVHKSSSATGASSTGTSTSSGLSNPTTVSSSTNSPTSSPVVPGPSTFKHGLSTGAKAGIAIGAVGVLLIVLLIAFLIRRHRSRVSKDSAIFDAPVAQESGLSTRDYPYPRVPELPDEKPMQMIGRKELATAANDLELKSRKDDKQRVEDLQSNELPTLENKHELEHSVKAAELQSPAWDGGQMQEHAFSPPYQLEPELDVGAGAPLRSSDSQSHPQQTFSQPFESFEPVATELPSRQHEPASSRASSQTILSDTSTAVGSSSRIDELRAKREKIRTEKERLLKLQELDEMEATVHREIMEEEERTRVTGSPK